MGYHGEKGSYNNEPIPIHVKKVREPISFEIYKAEHPRILSGIEDQSISNKNRSKIIYLKDFIDAALDFDLPSDNSVTPSNALIERIPKSGRLIRLTEKVVDFFRRSQE